MGYLEGITKARITNLGFTERQADVLHQLALGYTNKEIAEALLVSEKAVKWHLTNIYRTAKVKTRAELIQLLKKRNVYG